MPNIELPEHLQAELCRPLEGQPLSDLLCGIFFYFTGQYFLESKLEAFLWELHRIAPETFRNREIDDLPNVLGNLAFIGVLFNHHVNGSPDHYTVLKVALERREEVLHDRGIVPHHEVLLSGLATKLKELHKVR